MPVYEYQCQNCGHIFEEITNSHPSYDHMRCRRCRGYGQRLMSLSRFGLRDRGWAKEGYWPVAEPQAYEPV